MDRQELLEESEQQEPQVVQELDFQAELAYPDRRDHLEQTDYLVRQVIQEVLDQLDSQVCRELADLLVQWEEPDCKDPPVPRDRQERPARRVERELSERRAALDSSELRVPLVPSGSAENPVLLVELEQRGAQVFRDNRDQAGFPV